MWGFFLWWRSCDLCLDFTPLCWAAGNGAAFSAFPVMLPATPVRCQTQQGDQFGHILVFLSHVEILPGRESGYTSTTASELSCHSCWCISFTPDLVPLNRFHVIAKPANDHVCIVLWGKGKSSRAKRPKSSPSGTHSGHSSVAHLLQLVSTKKKAGGGGREKKKKTLVMFTDFCGRISGAF